MASTSLSVWEMHYAYNSLYADSAFPSSVPHREIEELAVQVALLFGLWFIDA